MRRRVTILLFIAAFSIAAKAQCPQFEPGLQVGTLAHNSLDEVSGIAASRQNSDVLWVHNDKGGSARVFAMNRLGTHLGIYNLSGAINYDWEDIAIGPGPVNDVDYLYVGDIGDNSDNRAYIRVFRVAEPVVDAQQSPIETTLTGVDTITLVYPDGERNAEALMVDPVTKDIYIISKEDSPSRVYRAPYPQSTTATITMEYKCELPWNKAAGGDISLDGDMIIVKTGSSQTINIASIWSRPEGTNLWDAFSGTQCAVELLWEQNGEAVCFDSNGWGYYTTSEELHQPIYYFASVNSKLSITEIMSDSSHAGTSGDWWELTYTGSSTVDLTGYSWDDNNERVGQNVFTSVTIDPGESIIILNEDSDAVNAWKLDWSLVAEAGVYDQTYFSSGFSHLGDSDGVFLYNPGGSLVTSVTYPSNTTGFSNEWKTDGTFLGLSVIGENGAYQSSHPGPNDVASPVYAVTCCSCSQADIYTDGMIDPKDYSVLANDWLAQGPSLDGDITGNGVVNLLDLKALMFHWLNSCE
ncbi:MAG: lamin tail domain-containing protein [Planctomycetota bacterium]